MRGAIEAIQGDPTLSAHVARSPANAVLRRSLIIAESCEG
jgi:hypothetical protein